MNGKMHATYKAITARVNSVSVINGKFFTLKEDCKNDYHTDQLAIIPAGTKIEADFACNTGMYGIVEVDGVLHKVKVELRELHKIDFGVFDARNEKALAKSK